MIKPEMTVTYESVTFKGCEGSGNHVFRPKTMSVSQWLEFWESVDALGEESISNLREQLKDAKEENADLKSQIEDLKDDIEYWKQRIDLANAGE